MHAGTYRAIPRGHLLYYKLVAASVHQKATAYTRHCPVKLWCYACFTCNRPGGNADGTVTVMSSAEHPHKLSHSPVTVRQFYIQSETATIPPESRTKKISVGSHNSSKQCSGSTFLGNNGLDMVRRLRSRESSSPASTAAAGRAFRGFARCGFAPSRSGSAVVSSVRC